MHWNNSAFLFWGNIMCDSCYAVTGYFRGLLKFPFISKFRVGFLTQLMSVTKFLPTVINVGWSADISIRKVDEKNEPLFHRGLVIICVGCLLALTHHGPPSNLNLPQCISSMNLMCPWPLVHAIHQLAVSLKARMLAHKQQCLGPRMLPGWYIYLRADCGEVCIIDIRQGQWGWRSTGGETRAEGYCWYEAPQLTCARIGCRSK
jgi:hypothetical protein